MKEIQPLATTGIGSVPFDDVEATIDLIAKKCPIIPHWPQMVRLAVREDMTLQAVDGLPCLEMDEQEHTIFVNLDGKEEMLTAFYERVMAGDYDFFAVPDEAGSALKPFLERAVIDKTFGPDFIKAQIIGPVSFGQSIRTPDDKTILDDPELADTVINGLGCKGAWLARQIRSIGRTPIVFFDEPSLTGFGSAFSSLNREAVIQMLNDVAALARSEGEVLVGTHICGNTDWGMITETNIDIINLDAFNNAEHIQLYPKEVKSFLERGGYIAWGIVPTLNFTGEETVEQMAGILINAWKALSNHGIDRELIYSRAIISPACGTGTISPEQADAVYNLLPLTAERIGNDYLEM